MITDSPLILIADHDTIYLELMDELLTEEGYRVLVVAGDTVPYYVIKEMQPNLVILDVPITKPDDAWLTLNLLRLDPMTQAIPVLICSTNTYLIRDSIEHLRKMGCSFLEKPFHLQAMLSEIQAQLDSGCVGETPSHNADDCSAYDNACYHK